MNAEQKRAWFLLVLDGMVCMGFIALGLAVSFRVAWAAFGLFFLAFLIPFIGRGEKSDERDAAIDRHATMAGGVACLAAFVLACMGTWFAVSALQRQESVSVHTLPLITGFGALVFWSVRSAAILVLYGRKTEADRA
jgi:hypothetical protein